MSRMGIGPRIKDARAGGSNGATPPLCTHYTRVYLERRWCIGSVGGRRASAAPYLGCSVTKVTAVARSGSPKRCCVRPEGVVRILDPTNHSRSRSCYERIIATVVEAN